MGYDLQPRQIKIVQAIKTSLQTTKKWRTALYLLGHIMTITTYKVYRLGLQVLSLQLSGSAAQLYKRKQTAAKIRGLKKL